MTNNELALGLVFLGRHFAFPSEGYENLLMKDGQPKPTEAAIEAALADAVAAQSAAATTKAQIVAAYDAMKAGTGTTGERAGRMEKAICYIAKNVLHLID